MRLLLVLNRLDYRERVGGYDERGKEGERREE